MFGRRHLGLLKRYFLRNAHLGSEVLEGLDLGV